MGKSTAMEKGWEFTERLVGVSVGTDAGHEYVSKVLEEIQKLEDGINNHPYRGQDVAHFKGYVAENWHAGSLNVNAAAAGSSDFATLPGSNQAASPDIVLDSGAQYSSKVYATAAESAKAQVSYDRNIHQSAYDGQHRLVPHDQLDAAREALGREALRNSATRPDVAKAYEEAHDRLTDVVKNRDGIKSILKDKADFEQMAKDGKNQEFSAEDHGLSASTAITTEYMLKQALDAGITAATISVVMQMAPEIYKAIDYLIKNKEINLQQLKQMGPKAISAGAEGFLRGSVACTLMIMCEKGMLGEAMKGVNPTVLGAAVSIVMGTIKNSILVAAGKMTAREMGAAFVDSLIVTAGFCAGTAVGKGLMDTTIGAKIGGLIGQALGVELPVVGYLIGTLVGCAFSVIYNIGKKKLLSFCVDSGFTCFGLVDQDYKLPEEVLNKMGIDTIKIPKTDIKTAPIEQTNVISETETNEYETVDITILRRGIIGVNKVGYVF